MSDFKVGDTVLVHAFVDDVYEATGSCLLSQLPKGHQQEAKWRRAGRYLHPYPGVPVADLLEELELVWQRLYRFHDVAACRHDYFEPENSRSEELRTARKIAAQKPKLEDGQEVWVRAVVSHAPTDIARGIVVRIGKREVNRVGVSREDIRTEEP